MTKLTIDPGFCYLASGYTIDLYCKYKNPDHVWDEFPHTYFHEKGSVARSRAKRAGWIIHKDRSATCPKCANKLKERS